MRNSVEPSCSRVLARLAVLALIVSGAAGCSGDSTRFNDSPYAARHNAPAEVTGSVQPAPYGRVVSQPFTPTAAPQAAAIVPPPPPPRRPARAEITGSIPPASSRPGDRSWSWEGGTAIMVVPGETLQTISKKYGVPAAAIMQANSLSAPAAIQPGQRLVIPRYNYYSHNTGAPATRVAANAPFVPAAPAASNVHVVNPGETIYSLARRYGIAPAAIAKTNNLSRAHRIKVGDRVIIPGNRPVQPVAAAPAQKPVAAAKPQTVAPAKPQAAAPANSKVAAAEPVPTARVAAPAAEPSIENASGPAAETTGAAPSFRWPVRGRVITAFGPKNNGQQNDGINLSVPEGTSVKVADDGVVAYAGSELKGYGNLVLVRHTNGFVTAYAHASELMVKKGDAVKRGQIIARAGATGNVTAPQLHFEIRKGATPVDPMQYLPGT